MQVFNTLTRKKEDLIPQEGDRIKMYVCGPTVYNYFHIGNARPLCVFDTLRRYLKYRGYEVFFVQNFTDIDDKIIRKAREEGVTPAQVAERFIEEYWIDADGLNVLRADMHPRATDNIAEICGMIEELVKKGHAYAAENGDVYFRTGSFAQYGKLSHQPLEDLQAGARIGIEETKEEAMDFALWKAAKPGEPSWDSPFGKGRPGWHIECSAMSRRYLGDTIDIHAGGQDLVFPHHENEVAQSESCTGVTLARYWMHNAHVNVDDRKMSKSSGNFFTVRDISKVYGYEPIRFLLLCAHYRSPLNYSKETIEQAVSALDRLYHCRKNLDFLRQSTDGSNGELQGQSDVRKARFIQALEEDFNTADAIAALFELVRDINTAREASREALDYAAGAFDEMTGVLGILYSKQTCCIPPEIEELAEQRRVCRLKKDFSAADALRREIYEKGYGLEDTPEGTKLFQR